MYKPLAILLAFTFSCSHQHPHTAAAESNNKTSLPLKEFVSSLKPEQNKTLQLPFESDARSHWHYIPKKHRHGLKVSDMSDSQYQHMMAVLEITLSKKGLDKVKAVMQMEQILREREGQHRDPKKYYFTLYGKAGINRWGYSFEGHHLSLNFSFDGDNMLSCTPMFLGANPALIPHNKTSQLKQGDAPLNDAELLAFKFFNSLNPTQKTSAFQRKIARRDMAEGHKKTPQEKATPAGISWKQLQPAQQAILLELIRQAYVANLNEDFALQQWTKIAAQKESLHFHFNGEAAGNKPHHYRISGSSLLILLYNTQKGSGGTPANHIHQLWRDSKHDFGALPERE